jgi:hypothetical protein
MSENGAGFLDVGTNERHEVVINLPRDMTGHIVFSVEQAEGLAATLTKKAREAQRAQREAAEAERIANVPPVDRTALCTTNGKTPDEVRAAQTNATGQHDGYIVLCDAERAKGFVRPYRDRYQHTTCGGVTTMGRALSETYARDPSFYGATFCCNCNAHFPVAQFVWSADGQPVGS